MRFLVDQPISPSIAPWLRDSGHDAFHLRDRGLSSAKDSTIFNLALAEDRILITSDLDFSRILALSGRQGPGLILFRAGNISDAEMLSLLRNALETLPLDQLPRSAVTIERFAIRMRPLPLRPDLTP